MSMNSKHDADCGYILVKKGTDEKFNNRHYKTSAGAQRSAAWKKFQADILSVDEYNNRRKYA